MFVTCRIFHALYKNSDSLYFFALKSSRNKKYSTFFSGWRINRLLKRSEDLTPCHDQSYTLLMPRKLRLREILDPSTCINSHSRSLPWIDRAARASALSRHSHSGRQSLLRIGRLIDTPRSSSRALYLVLVPRAPLCI